jgi:serine/threonine protein kinase
VSAVTVTGQEPLVVQEGAEVLPGYRAVALLARGGRVDTYDAISLERDCRVVVKVVRPDRRDEARVRAALLLEGELLTTLDHPHLVRGYEAVSGPVAAVVLETLPGATLAALLQDRPLGVADAALLGRQLVSALAYLHRRGWLHLDVKPENVVVQEGRAVLIDLGLATPPGPVPRSLGTVGYAAPEQDAGGTVTAASDVWGLGAALYESVTGVVPGRRPDLARVQAPLRGLVAGCLQTDPVRRPSLDEVRARLDVLVGTAAPRWWPRRGAGTRRWVPRPRSRGGRYPGSRIVGTTEQSLDQT